MRGSLRIARFAGINVYVHWSFWLLVAFVLAQGMMAGVGWIGTLGMMAFVAALFACVVMHEYGHALTARRFGISTRDITLLPIGGVARLEKMPEDPREELLVAAAGPAVNVVIGAILAAVLLLAGQCSFFHGWDEYPFLGSLLIANVVLVAFNILPVFPMDGGRMLRALLAMKWNYAQATRWAAGVGQGMAVLFGLLALMDPGRFLVLGFVGLFVFFVARHESRAVQLRWLIRGVPVRRAMVTDAHALRPTDTFRTAGPLISYRQQDFPVVESGELVGMVYRNDWDSVLKSHQAEAPVAEFMRTDVSPVDEEAMLADVLRTMQETGQPSLPVTRNGHLVGLLTAESISDVMVRAAQEKRGETPREREAGDPLHAADSESWTAIRDDRKGRVRSER